MKKKILIVIGCILICAFLILLYFNLTHPIKVVSVNVVCQNWDATYESLEAFAESYNNGSYNKERTIVHNFNGKLPSDDPKDYADVYIDLTFKNRSPFQHYTIDGYIEKFSKNGEMAICSGIMSDIFFVQVFRMTEKEGRVLLTIYTGDRSDEEIKEMIRGIEMTFVAEGSIIGKQKFDYNLSEVEDITMER